MPRGLNMSGFCMYQGSEHFRVLNNQAFEYASGSNYARVLNILGFCI